MNRSILGSLPLEVYDLGEETGIYHTNARKAVIGAEREKKVLGEGGEASIAQSSRSGKASLKK